MARIVTDKGALMDTDDISTVTWYNDSPAGLVDDGWMITWKDRGRRQTMISDETRKIIVKAWTDNREAVMGEDLVSVRDREVEGIMEARHLEQTDDTGTWQFRGALKQAWDMGCAHGRMAGAAECRQQVLLRLGLAG